jgi:hypothetical protein
MGAAGAQRRFRTRHSPRIHAKKRNFAGKTNVIAARTPRRKCPGRSFNAHGPNEQAKRTKEHAMIKMTKTLTALAAAATIAVAAVATPQPAEARGGALAAGIIGGLAAGAIIGAAVNGPYYGYGPGYYYGPRPVYYDGPCYWTRARHRVWDGWGWRYQRVRVCD